MAFTDLTPAERSSRARLAAHSKWADTDRVDGTAAARAAFLGRFEQQVDPAGDLHPTERAKRAESAKRAYFQQLAFSRRK